MRSFVAVVVAALGIFSAACAGSPTEDGEPGSDEGALQSDGHGSLVPGTVAVEITSVDLTRKPLPAVRVADPDKVTRIMSALTPRDGADKSARSCAQGFTTKLKFLGRGDRALASGIYGCNLGWIHVNDGNRELLVYVDDAAIQSTAGSSDPQPR